MLDLALSLALATAVAPPAPPPAPPSSSGPCARIHHAPAFLAWLGDAVVVRELEARDLCYAVKPNPSAEGVDGAPATFSDAFFLTDGKGRVVSSVSRSNAGDTTGGCVAPGGVDVVEVAGGGAVRYGRRALPGTSHCFVRVDAGRKLRFDPDPQRSLSEQLPAAVLRAAKAAAPKGASITWLALPGTNDVVAQASSDFRLVVIDRASGRVNKERSAAIEDELGACAESGRGGTREHAGLDGTIVDRGLLYAWGGAGTALMECACLVTSELEVTCETWATRLRSPAMQAELDQVQEEQESRGHFGDPIVDEQPSVDNDDDGNGISEADARAALRSLRALLQANAAAKDAWRAHRTDEAIASWLGSYRRFLALGRAPPTAALDGPWSDVVTQLGGPGLRGAAEDAWAEMLNDLGFALAQQGELHQARGAYGECRRWLDKTGRTRPILEKNERDLERAILR